MKKTFIFFICVLICLLRFNINVAYAVSINMWDRDKCHGCEDFGDYEFTPSNNKFVVAGSVNFKWLEFKFAKNSTTSEHSYVMKVTDSKGNIIFTGSDGYIPLGNLNFPITFSVDFGSSGSVYEKVYFFAHTEECEKYNPSGGSTEDEPVQPTEPIVDLSSLLDKLFNPKYLDDGLNKLEKALDRVNDTPITKTVQGIADSFNKMGDVGKGVLPSLTITIPSVGTFNMFDLSHFWNIISIIRALLVAVLYMGLFIFFIRCIVPKFKV